MGMNLALHRARRLRTNGSRLLVDGGFTLIELMLVVVIIGILAAVAVPRLVGKTQRARIATTSMTIQNVSTALESFELEYGHFPSTEEGLDALMNRPASIPAEVEWAGPFLKEIPFDGWKRVLVYKCPPERGVDYDLFSTGADGQEGTEDDIVNYRKTE